MRLSSRAGVSGVATWLVTTTATIAFGTGVAWAAPAATGTPATGLKDGSVVTIEGTGFGSNTAIYIVQCSSVTDPNGCDTHNIATATSDVAGNLKATLTVHTGTIGSGTCSPGSATCSIAMADLGKQYPAFFPIGFAKTAAPKPSATPSASMKPVAPTQPTQTANATPAGAGSVSSGTDGGGSGGGSNITVSAGSGGDADREGPNTALAVAVIVVGGVAISGTAFTVLSRRRAKA